MSVDPEHGGPAGRLEDFAEHLASCQADLLAYVFALVQNMADAEDICQRTALVLWQKFDQYQPGTNFTSWALKIARYEALNFIRRRRRERLFFSEETVQLLADSVVAQADARLATESRWADLRHCLEKLPLHHQKLLRLYYEGSRTISQVASSLGRTEIAVRSSLCRTRKALRTCVEGLSKQGARK